jgi:hypothetical protein
MVLLLKAPRAYLRIIRRRIAQTRKEAGDVAGIGEDEE